MNADALQFAHPELVPLLWIWLAIVAGLIVLERRGSDALDRLVGLALQQRLVDRPSRWRRWARIALLGVSGVAMAFALMQPQWGERYIATPRVGAEIMIALDVSRSMLADDARPTRLERAKAEIRDLLSYLGDDYVGLIAFAGRASVLSPMTPDKSFLRLALDSAGPHSVSRGGTKLAEPILRAVAGFGEPGPAQRALILITDGEDHDSFALDAANAAAEAGIKIIAIGFGDEGGSPIYLRDPRTGVRSQVLDAEGSAVYSRLNGDLLREIALATDGAFVPAGTGVLDLASIYDAHIAKLTRGQLDERGRTIRDEVYQSFLMVGFVCLIAGVWVTAGRRRGSFSVGAVMVLVLSAGMASIPPTARAEAVDATAPAGERLAADSEAAPARPGGNSIVPGADEALALAAGSDAEESLGDAPPSAGDSAESPRSKFNRANEALSRGDGVTATALLRAARRDAADDPELRFAATYNLGMAAVARADALAATNSQESLSALHEAADWFRDASSARPDESDPRHNLDVTLRRALVLADEIARTEQGEIEEELDGLIAAQRERVGTAAALLEEVSLAGELDSAERLRPAFGDAATQQRLLISSADELAERVERERNSIQAQPEESRAPEDALRVAQLDGVLVYLDGALDRMSQTRRQLRQQRGERAYRRGSAALGELKRARDQLRDPVQLIGVLVDEVGQLVAATNALASSQRKGLEASAALPGTQPPRVPAFLTASSLEEESRRLENRVRELGFRLEQAAIDAESSAQAPAGGPMDPNSAGAPSAAERQALLEALVAAAPLVSEAGLEMESATSSIGSESFEAALGDEIAAGRKLADARERFFDLRQLLDATHADEARMAEMAEVIAGPVSGGVDPEEVALGKESGPVLLEIQTKNLERAARLEGLLERERENRLSAIAAEQAQAPQASTTPPEDSEDDPAQAEEQRFLLAGQLLALADGAMREAEQALASGESRNPEIAWPVVAETTGRARDHLDAIRTLFFTLVEHVRKLAIDQIDLSDETQDVIALAATESPDGDPAAAVPADSERGPDTRARAQVLAIDQGQLEERGGALADALFEGAEAAASAPQAADADPAPEGEPEPERIRRAAEHVATAQLAMQDAKRGFEDVNAPLPPAHEAQQLAIEELKAALELLSPPPPPPDPNEGDQEQNEPEEGEQRQESQPEPQNAQDESAGASETPEAAEEEPEEDPSQLLQGVRDREAERRQDRDREQERRRSQPVDKDW
jgi:Ca-activated chloride channel family protein